MKTITLCFLLLQTFSVSLMSQETKPIRYIAGGALGFSHSNNVSGDNTDISITVNRGEYARTTFAIQPYVGKYLSEKIILGINGGYGRETIKTPLDNREDHKEITNAVSAGLFLRYLFNPDQQLVFQLEPAAVFDHLISKQEGDFVIPGNESKISVAGVRVVPLLTYRLSERVNIIGRLGSLQFIAGQWEEGPSEDKHDFNQFGMEFSSRTVLFGVEMNW